MAVRWLRATSSHASHGRQEHVSPDQTEQSRPFLRRVVINTMASGAAAGWSILVSLITLPILLNGLGPAGLGAWALLQTFSAHNGWTALLDLGSGTAVTRFAAARLSEGDRDGAARLATANIVLSTSMATFGSVALIAATRLGATDWFGLDQTLGAQVETAALILAVQLPIDMASRSMQLGLEGVNRVDLSRLSDSIRRTGAAVAAATAAALTGDLVMVATWTALTSAVAALIAFLFLRSEINLARFGRTEVDELLRYGRKIAVLRPLGTIHRMADRVVVGVILGPAAVALVEIATQVQNGAEAVLSSSAHSVPPTASWLDARGDRASLRDLLIRGTRLSLLVTLPFVIAPAVAASPLLSVWIGEFDSSLPLLVAVAIAYTGITAGGHVASQLLVGVGDAGAVFRAASTSLVINLAATVVLVSTIGVVGAFVGSLIAAPITISMLVRSALANTECGVGHFLRDTIAPVLVPAAALAAISVIVVLADFAPLVSLALIATIGGITYAALALIREAELASVPKRLQWLT